MASFIHRHALEVKPLPEEFENVYSGSYHQSAEAVITAGRDRRVRVMDDDSDTRGYPGIGLFRALFNFKKEDGSQFRQVTTGTASLITDDVSGHYILTVAHNMIYNHKLNKKFTIATSAWFEFRNNQGEATKRRYNVTHYAVYPKYWTNPTTHSGFDLALCWIQVPRDDYFVKQLCSKPNSDYMPRPIAGEYSTTRVAVVGYPGVHEGEKWGMVEHVPIEKRQDWMFKKDVQKKLLVYNFIDTSEGQSGSPVMGMSPRDVIGVHTGGDPILKNNWATYLNRTKLQWIADCQLNADKGITYYFICYLKSPLFMILVSGIIIIVAIALYSS